MVRISTEAKSTWGIPPKVRKTIRSFILQMREALEEDFIRQLTTLGLTSQGIGDVPAARLLKKSDARVRDAAIAVISRLIDAGHSHREAFDVFVRDSAFTFLNRMVGLRCLEERGMLIIDNRAETAIRQDPNLRASSLYFRAKSELPEDTPPREVWRETLDRATRATSERIGVVFDPDSEYGRFLPLQPTLTKIIGGLNDQTIPPEVYAEDELLGWVYQYYNAEEKDTVYAKLGKGGKIESPEELAAASCLYTERYMVDFLLQNTLGALWVRMHPDTQLPQQWPYYVRSPKGQLEPSDEKLPERVRDITLLDPAVGSGHFLIRAFDLLAQMYEEEGLENPKEVPGLILARNLHGIDIDLRAAQISALALYLKGCDLTGPDFRPSRINLVSADVVLPGVPPASLLNRYTGERDIQELMVTLWAELKDAPSLGSLLHPERKIDELLQRRRRGGHTLMHQDGAAWDRFKVELLEGLREEFEKEAQSEDIGQRLFGENLAKTISLVEVLSRRYDVVVANPPYAGSKNLNAVVRRQINYDFKEGKRDLYAAFIMRCIEFVKGAARVGMVTQQSWMFLRSFAKLRERVIEDASIGGLAHLGPRAFEEIGGEVVSVALFTLTRTRPDPDHQWSAFRLIGPKSPVEKERLLLSSVSGNGAGLRYEPKQSDILAIPEAPFVYWLRPRFFELLQSERRLSNIAEVRQGLATTDNERFLRCFWEVRELGLVEDGGPGRGRWFWYAKGGRYQKWAGLEWLVIDWENDGQKIKELVVTLPGNTHWSRRIPSPEYYFRPGLTYTQVSRGSMGTRLMISSIFDVKGISIFCDPGRLHSLAALLSTRAASFLLRVTTQNLEFHAGYVSNLPLPGRPIDDLDVTGRACFALKRLLVAEDATERSFAGDAIRAGRSAANETLLSTIGARLAGDEARAAVLHAVEGWNEHVVFNAYELHGDDVRVVLDETGTPAGWHPFLERHDKFPCAPDDIELPDEFHDFLDSLGKLDPTLDELLNLKRRLQTLYQAGPGAEVEADEEGKGGNEEAVLGARIAIPTETFLEEISQKLHIHPITVYNLLQEMREEDGLFSPPVVREQMENFTSVTLLRLLGYRWPEQDAYEAEHGVIAPMELLDPDGIIPLVVCNEQPTAADRIRASLEHRFGAEGAARSEEEFLAWTGKKLEAWLEKEFFRRHITQFRRRPIAWHLTSSEGTFQALVLYHKLSKAMLGRIRTLYAGELINRLRAARERGHGDAAAARRLALQIEDVEDFIDRLKAIEEGRTLEARIRCRWKDEAGEGRPGPYAPDIDDGVKVNVRPFQEMGLLARKVISTW